MSHHRQAGSVTVDLGAQRSFEDRPEHGPCPRVPTVSTAAVSSLVSGRAVGWDRAAGTRIDADAGAGTDVAEPLGAVAEPSGHDIGARVRVIHCLQGGVPEDAGLAVCSSISSRGPNTNPSRPGTARPVRARPSGPAWAWRPRRRLVAAFARALVSSPAISGWPRSSRRHSGGG